MRDGEDSLRGHAGASKETVGNGWEVCGKWQKWKVTRWRVKEKEWGMGDERGEHSKGVRMKQCEQGRGWYRKFVSESENTKERDWEYRRMEMRSLGKVKWKEWECNEVWKRK